MPKKPTWLTLLPLQLQIGNKKFHNGNKQFQNGKNNFKFNNF